MHSGELAEWVAAIAESLSVIVALLLPYYNSHKEKKLKRRNVKIVIKKMTERAIRGDKDGVEHLRAMLTNVLFNNLDSRLEDIIDSGQQIYEILKDHRELSKEDIQQLHDLLDQIDNK
ncbi:hypothetical protein DY120_05260 [Apilactobacillus micheneri]|uniref:Uncharacterized protein n=2 Tax=Apilactobacillus micheneri TaxID=1899430 RepID=A0ABY2YYM7_9LACO|nr:hypothetical protein [Apilactobacillus micheneri]TPR24688.1 hypothetical protein DY114_05260 [Apilactobacillus micheneri]TPR25999.1 hypothetical protein DY111_05260 [Apilactobacillus micheneri]TPR28189.1 hypothetical protein DY113_03205 [Apilactobacillus micheneri]TPR29680.1 hypothetical protein DY117_05260 [Apilactobacillus micheneri]TPR30466.1 hypothetical protein DY120_05260 [Apilactobacillus micheneri]